MSVEQFDPQSPEKTATKENSKARNSIAKATTTLETPVKVLAEQESKANSEGKAAKIGFVSLGCPKNLVDSERILTQLRTEGYDVTNSYDDAELVIVNTCGFIDSAVQESLDTIGEALAANGKVLVTGCLGV